MKHIEYGVMVASPDGHRYLDQTFLTKTAAEEYIKYVNNTYTIVRREVEVILGEWEPVGEKASGVSTK